MPDPSDSKCTHPKEETDTLLAEATALVESMNTPNTHAAFDAVFAMTGEELGAAWLKREQARIASSDLAQGAADEARHKSAFAKSGE